MARTVVFYIRLPEEEYLELRRDAQRAGLPASTYGRLLLKAARRMQAQGQLLPELFPVELAV